MNRKRFALFGFVTLGIALGILISTVLIPLTVSCTDNADKIGAKNPPVVLNDNIKALNDAYVSASNAVVPTVVSISVVIEDKKAHDEIREQFRDFFKFFGEPDNGGDDKTPHRAEGAGSGVIVTNDGYIVTNNHVVENAVEINVTTNDQKVHKAKLIGKDPLTDLALIKIEGNNYPVAFFGNMDNVHVGEMVIAVGNPLGLNSTVTKGIVSAIGRGGLGLENRSRYSVENFIQTDAAINPGNSGGGLYNLEGSLIGINSAIATRTGTYIGYGFAIPIDLVKAVIVDLINYGKINRGYIGVQIKSIDEIEAKSAGLDKVEGVMVNDVIKGGAGEKAGMEVGDIILELNGKPVKTSNELQSLIVMHHAGDMVNLLVLRDGKRITKSVKLTPAKTDAEEEKTIAGEERLNEEDLNKPMSFDKLGFSIAPLTKEIKKSNDVQSGVVISKVERYGKAAERGLVPNGVIVKADRKSVNSPDQLRKIIESKRTGDILVLQVKYPDSNRIVAIEMQ